jgi:DNA-binding response OmpR family regulator
MAGERVLIIEDEKDVREVLAEMVLLFGYRVSVAINAEHAWKMIASTAYDLVIADLKLPGMDGAELVRTMRLKGIQTPALVIAGVDIEQKNHRLLNLKDCGFVQKPFKIDDIRIRIRELLDKKRQEPKNKEAD